MWRACHVSQRTQLSADTDLYGLADLHTAIRPGLFHSLEQHGRLCGDVLGSSTDKCRHPSLSFYGAQGEAK